MSDDKMTQMAAEATVRVTISDIQKMLAMIQDAQEPRVKFSTNMTAMENEAHKISTDNITAVAATLLKYLRK